MCRNRNLNLEYKSSISQHLRHRHMINFKRRPPEIKHYANATKLKHTSVKRTSGTHDKPHILEIRYAFFECAVTAPNYRVRNYKFCKDFIEVFYTNFNEQ